jgi:hypothetical protein
VKKQPKKADITPSACSGLMETVNVSLDTTPITPNLESQRLVTVLATGGVGLMRSMLLREGINAPASTSTRPPPTADKLTASKTNRLRGAMSVSSVRGMMGYLLWMIRRRGNAANPKTPSKP